jgi:predicted lipoprotein with Yx(FWY)xxD motif
VATSRPNLAAAIVEYEMNRPTQGASVTRSRPITLLAGVTLVPLTALAVAGCGGGNSATAASQTPAHTSQSAARHAPTVSVAKTHLGKILVNSRGRTLYLFKKDSGTKSACFGACATAWPPLRTGGKPTAGKGAKASLLGTTRRSDGKPQVTYNGHPLYTFIMDKKAGQTNGEGFTAFGARWFVLSAAGKQVSPRSAKQSGGTSSSAAPAPAATPTPPAPTPAPTSTPAPRSTPTPTATPPASNGIPQNDGGDHDSDNNGGPDDGDGGI